MTVPVVSVDAHLAWARVRGAGDGASWTAEPNGEGGPTAESLRARAVAASQWAIESTSSKRIGWVVVDVAEAVCAWVRSPSAAEPVLTASLRNATQEWGDLAPIGAIEPVVPAEAPTSAVAGLIAKRRGATAENDEAAPEAPPAPGQAPSHHQGRAVITFPDSLVRLWMDQLDSRGVRVGGTMTLWHAMARAWSDPANDEVTAIALVGDNRRVVWAWARGADLLAGGTVEVAPPTESPTEHDAPDAQDDSPAAPTADGAAKRLWLDWLAWSSQLGDTPARLVVVGADAEAWSGRIAEGWRSLECEAEETDDALASTLDRLAEAPVAGVRSGLDGLAGLSNRPTRAVRGRYRLVSLTLVCLLVALGSVAFRLSQKAATWRERAGELQLQSREAALACWPGERPTGNIRRWAANKYETELNEGPAFEAPPAPEQILAEAERLFAILAEEAGQREEDVRLQQILLDQGRGNQLRFKVGQRETATAINLRIQGEDRYVQWEPSGRDRSPLTPRLSGIWRNLSSDTAGGS